MVLTIWATQAVPVCKACMLFACSVAPKVQCTGRLYATCIS